MKEKKIGLAIVTYGTNYGTYLQAFATQYIIRELGNETEVIDINSVKKEVSNARKKYFLSRIFDISELNSYLYVFLGLINERTNKKYKEYIDNRKKQFNIFKNEKFNFSCKCDSWEGLSKLCNDNYNNIVVGSDQLWRPANIAGNFYTLNFVPDNINKISYATSFGIKEIRVSQKEIAKSFIERINHLSVREKSGALIVKELTGRNIPVVCDPTLLLSKKDWSQFLSVKPSLKEKYILCYFLGGNKNHRNFANKLAKATGCKVVGVLHIAGYISIDKSFSDIVPTNIGPFEFLNLVNNAEYVCTDSFHGCVFSIIFNKKLFAFRRFNKQNKMSTNDRINTLLGSLGMEDRLIWGTEVVDDCIKMDINYSKVEEKIEKIKLNSINYLKNAINNEKTDI